MLVVVVLLVAGAAGCGGSTKKHAAVLPVVHHPSTAFGRRADVICARASRALERDASSLTAPVAEPVAIFERELRQLKQLHPPQRERAAFADLLNAFNQEVFAWGRIVLFPNGMFEIWEKNLVPNHRLIVALSRRLGAEACVAEVSTVKAKRKPMRKRPKPG
jgi:hypothetical protein